MPGDNCSVVGCGTCRRTKGIGIWKLPAARNEAYRKWRKDWLNELTKYRVADKDFQRQIEKDKVFTCEKHFHESDIETCKFEHFTIHVRSTSEHQRKRKPFLAPYTSVHDERFQWLESNFLRYLREWLQSTKEREGDFTKNARSKMFLSWQTYEGLQITVHSVIEATRFVLTSNSVVTCNHFPMPGYPPIQPLLCFFA